MAGIAALQSVRHWTSTGRSGSIPTAYVVAKQGAVRVAGTVSAPPPGLSPTASFLRPGIEGYPFVVELICYHSAVLESHWPLSFHRWCQFKPCEPYRAALVRKMLRLVEHSDTLNVAQRLVQTFIAIQLVRQLRLS